MLSAEIRKKFLEFFKKRGHAIVPSSSLIPDDPSVLLTTAGMQQFKRYFTGEIDPVKDFGNKNTASIQKSFRTSDIDEVGDESHLTFFEMLGNFSFGGYFKKEAIKYAHEFITGKEWMGLAIDYVSVFDQAKVPDGDWRKGVPFDEESYQIWREIVGLPEEKIHREGIDNFWGPTGNEGPCGPTTEIYLKNKGGQSIEIWNIVFNEYYCTSDKNLRKLETPGVDTGMGLERLAMVSQGVSNIFETDLFTSLVGDKYGNKFIPEDLSQRVRRIVLDHARGIVFLISDGVRPSNKETGYILRKLMRRVLVHEYRANNSSFSVEQILHYVCENYKQFYQNLDFVEVKRVYNEEDVKYMTAIKKGLKKMNDLLDIDAQSAFALYESYGLPYEIIKEVGGEQAVRLKREDFDKEFAKHQEISRAGQEKKFGGHGLILDTGELKAGNEEELSKVLRLHTATHLLQRALREVLGPEVGQMGSDITAERTRFDFAFPRKLVLEEIKKVEDLVNQKIKEDLPVNFVELPKAEAKKAGALSFFREKYPDKVKVYFIGKDLESAWSKEFCGGPHVKHTGIIGKFRIAKEEAVGAGARRVRGVLE
ncbi:MAG: alanine--tRNA ligase-related protein [bacterium]|nr:alanine--tRNA ligase-related protein [bacterium]